MRERRRRSRRREIPGTFFAISHLLYSFLLSYLSLPNSTLYSLSSLSFLSRRSVRYPPAWVSDDAASKCMVTGLPFTSTRRRDDERDKRTVL